MMDILESDAEFSDGEADESLYDSYFDGWGKVAFHRSNTLVTSPF